MVGAGDNGEQICQILHMAGDGTALGKRVQQPARRNGIARSGDPA